MDKSTAADLLKELSREWMGAGRGLPMVLMEKFVIHQWSSANTKKTSGRVAMRLANS